MTMPTQTFRFAMYIPVVLLPLGSTTLIPHQMFGVPGANALNISLLIAMATLGLIRLIEPWKVALPKWPAYFWVFVLMMTLGALHGSLYVDQIPDYFRTLQVISFETIGGYLQDTFFKQMLILVTAFLFSVAVRNAYQPTLCLVPLFVSTLILPIAVITIFSLSNETLSSLASSDSRGFLSVVGMHANELGLLFNMIFALALFCFDSVSGSSKKLALGLICITLIAAIALTFSRGAYLGFVAVIVYFLATKGQLRISTVAVVLAILSAMLMPEALIERASSGLTPGDVQDVSAGRISGIWLPLTEDILRSPIFGNGRSSILWTEAAMQQSILPVGHPHSAYIAAILDYGLVGVLIIFGFYLHMWRVFKALAERSIDSVWRGFFRGSMACILLLLVQGVTDDSFAPGRTQPFLWLAYGVAVGLLSRVNAQTRVAAMKNVL